MVSEAIIIGAGSSITREMSDLKSQIVSKFTILTNYSFRHFSGTFLTCIDREFYLPTPKPIGQETNPDYYDELSKLPLIISTDTHDMCKIKHSNTILLKVNPNYQREKCLNEGFYTGNLTGIFALTIASYLMNYTGRIFLLGFDWNMRNKKDVDPTKYSGRTSLETHYYSDIKHRGIGYVGYYENHNPDTFFKYFKEPKLKIYNVSLNSNINTFEKINYDDFYKLLSKDEVNQEELREEIKIKLH